MNNLKVLTMIAGMALTAAISRADLLSGCGTCQGATYLLQYNPNNTTTSGPDTVYDVFLTIDTTNYNGGGAYLNAVAIKIANSVDVPPSTLVSAPGGTGAWTLQFGGLNASGCNGAGSGFICAQDGHSAPVPAGSYTWEFHYATTSSLSSSASIKAQYVDAQGNKVGALVSEDITLQRCTTDCGGTTQGGVPEPSSMLLFGTLLGLTGLGLRKWQKA